MMRFVLICCALFLSSSAAAEPTWNDVEAVTDWKSITVKKHKIAGPVEVYSRTISGTPCFRAIANTTAPAAVMMDVAMDIVGSLQWSSAGLTRSEILGKGNSSLDYLQYIDVPGWTFSSDRFWILRGTAAKTSSKSQFTWHRLGENGGPYSAQFLAVKESTKAIEPPVNVGGWEFLTGAGQTMVRYTICTDSGGSVPRGLQNIATKTTLPDTVGDLIRESLQRAQ